MIAPIGGVWDIVVDNDNITVIKGFIFRRHWKFSEISDAKINASILEVYAGNKKAFSIETNLPTSKNFIERLEKENKPLI